MYRERKCIYLEKCQFARLTLVHFHPIKSNKSGVKQRSAADEMYAGLESSRHGGLQGYEDLPKPN